MPSEAAKKASIPVPLSQRNPRTDELLEQLILRSLLTEYKESLALRQSLIPVV